MDKKKSTLVNQLVQIYSDKHLHQKMFANANKNYQISLYKINKFSPQQILIMYQIIKNKSYNVPELYTEQFWFQNELKVFIWSLVAFSYHRQLIIQKFASQQWSLFSNAFNQRPIDFSLFQANLIIKPQLSTKNWHQQEQQLLKIIIAKNQFTNKWNFIARQLFKLSDKRYYRTPKQCRQRWFNHLDPAKKHTPWTPNQDIQLFNYVKTIGKKWAQISKLFNNTRTQHMIKNRYKAIVYSYTKKYPKIKQDQLIERIINSHQNQITLQEKKENKIKTLKPKIKKIKENKIISRRISPRKKTNVIELSRKQSVQKAFQLNSILNLNIIQDCFIEKEKQITKNSARIVIQQEKDEQKIVRTPFSVNNMQFFEQIDSKMSNIPFLLQNEDMDSFISKCIQITGSDCFDVQRMECEQEASDIDE